MQSMDSDYKMYAVTGRVKAFLDNPKGGTLPASCMAYKLEGSTTKDYRDIFYIAQKALVTGAGVALHLDGFEPNFPIGTRLVDNADDADVIVIVQDQMDTDEWVDGYGIMEATGHLYRVLREAWVDTVYVDVSQLRAEGAIGSKGQVASGPDSFMKIFKAVEKFAQDQTITSLLRLLSMFNEVIRRGGVYKNGALTTALPLNHPHFLDYLSASKVNDHPWLSKNVVIPSDWTDFPLEMTYAIKAYNNSHVWFQKAISQKDNVTWLPSGNMADRLLLNVCLEILLKSLGTCILLPINLGMAKGVLDIVEGMENGMKDLCKFQQQDHQKEAGIYLSAHEDRQVGLGMLGLANLLANKNISYQDFTEKFKNLLDSIEAAMEKSGVTKLQDLDLDVELLLYPTTPKLNRWVFAFVMGVYKAAKVAERYGMERAFAIAPTASVAFRFKDFLGYTCAPEISPPLSQKVERLSSTMTDPTVYRYPPNVEVAAGVDEGVYFELMCCFQRLFDLTGMGHSISMNHWVDLDYDKVKRWADSPMKVIYYRWEVEQSFLDKSDQLSCGVDGCG